MLDWQRYYKSTTIAKLQKSCSNACASGYVIHIQNKKKHFHIFKDPEFLKKCHKLMGKQDNYTTLRTLFYPHLVQGKVY